MVEMRCFKILLLPWNKLDKKGRAGFETVSVTGIHLNKFFFWEVPRV